MIYLSMNSAPPVHDFVTTMACLSEDLMNKWIPLFYYQTLHVSQVSSSVWKLVIVPLVVPNNNKLYAIRGILKRTYLKFSIQFSIRCHHMLIFLLSGCFDEDLFGFQYFFCILLTTDWLASGLCCPKNPWSD